MNPPHAEVTEDDDQAAGRRVLHARPARSGAWADLLRAIAHDAWPAHLEKMYAFWSSVMLTSGRYKGDPVSTHRNVVGVEPPMFGNWLDLFEATAVELFRPEIADQFALKARRIAESLKLAMFFRPDQAWPEDLRQRPKVTSPCA